MTMDPELLSILLRIERRIVAMHTDLLAMEQAMSQELDDLKREVAENKTVLELAATKLQEGLDQISALRVQIDQLNQNKDDPAAIEAIAQELDAQTKALEEKLQPFQPSGNT